MRMRRIPFIHLMAVTIVWLIAFSVVPALRPRAAAVQTRAETGQNADAEFQAMLARLDGAQLELQNGRPGAFKALWSRRDDITLSGGFGGTIEKGWEQINRRLDWVGTQFSKGTNTIERLVANASGDLGYVV